jgi:hypothetical protein
MSSKSEPYPTVQFLIDKFADWLKHRRELSEIRQLNRTDFELIASDLRVSPHDLDELVRREHAPTSYQGCSRNSASTKVT